MMTGWGYSSVVERLVYNIVCSIRCTEKKLSHLKPKVIFWFYVLQEYMESKEGTFS